MASERVLGLGNTVVDDGRKRPAQTCELLRTRFREGSIEEMAATIDQIVLGISKREPITSTVALYRELAQAIPRISPQKQSEALQAGTSDDTDIAKKGKKVILLTSLGTVLTSVADYLSVDRRDEEDIVQAALEQVLRVVANRSSEKVSIAQAIYYAARDGAKRYLAEKEVVPVNWVSKGVSNQINQKIAQVVVCNPKGLRVESVRRLAEDIRREFAVSAHEVEALINLWQLLVRAEDPVDQVVQAVDQHLLKEEVGRALSLLTPGRRRALELRFNLRGEGEHTLREVGEELNVTESRAWELVLAGLGQLRQPRILRKRRAT